MKNLNGDIVDCYPWCNLFCVNGENSLFGMNFSAFCENNLYHFKTNNYYAIRFDIFDYDG